MPPRSSSILAIPSFLLPFARGPVSVHARWLSQGIRGFDVPRPTPFVPDTQTFLTLIGRNLSQHASKIPSWKALFTFTSEQFKELGIEPPRNRRYLLSQREKFRKGEYGIGGDLQHVKDGVALLRVVALPPSEHSAAPVTPTLYPFAPKRRVVVNVPEDGSALESPAEKPIKGIKLKGGNKITGHCVLPVQGGKLAKLQVVEGLWENRRGRKIDGGERRRAEIRFKRRAAERRATR